MKRHSKHSQFSKKFQPLLLFLLVFILSLNGIACSSNTTSSTAATDPAISETSDLSSDPETEKTYIETEEATEATESSSESEDASQTSTAEQEDTEGTSGTTEEEGTTEEVPNGEDTSQEESITLADIPEYTDSPYVILENNIPDFDEDDLTDDSYEDYSELDDLGRCGTACASISTDTMPTEERESIEEVTPSGWHSVTYSIVDGSYLYNRCHLIGYQLSGENDNEENLITGTRYMNVEGMLPFENMVADYIEETGNHVLYRVTPIFEDDNLVASGVEMEAESVEDEGEGILFHVYVYNVQPGVVIDYATGDSWLDEEYEETDSADENDTEETTYILNTNTMKFHDPSCSSVDQISEDHKVEYTGSREDLIAEGYEPCGNCNP